jgi:hypothetical protein
LSQEAGWREVEDKPFVAIKPGADLWMLMDGVVVEDDVDGFLGGTTVPDNPFKTKTIRGTDFDRGSSTHAPDSQMRDASGIPKRSLPLGGNH